MLQERMKRPLHNILVDLRGLFLLVGLLSRLMGFISFRLVYLSPSGTFLHEHLWGLVVYPCTLYVL